MKLESNWFQRQLKRTVEEITKHFCWNDKETTDQESKDPQVDRLVQNIDKELGRLRESPLVEDRSYAIDLEAKKDLYYDQHRYGDLQTKSTMIVGLRSVLNRAQHANSQTQGYLNRIAAERGRTKELVTEGIRKAEDWELLSEEQEEYFKVLLQITKGPYPQLVSGFDKFQGTQTK